MPDCDVIIVNFNAGDFLRNAVTDVLQSPRVSSVVIVDNASSDNSLDLVPAHEKVILCRNRYNMGFAAACNIGIARTQSECVLLLNPDCRIAPETIERLVTVLLSSDRIGMVGPRILNEDGTEQAGGRRKIPTPRLAFVRAAGLSRLFPRRYKDFALHLEPLPDGPTDVEAISGACMLVRRAAITNVGLMDDGYFLHCEDLDWCMRFMRLSWRTVFVPDAVVSHHKGVSSRTRRMRVEMHKHRGMARFARKFFVKQYPPWMSLLIHAGIWMRFVSVATQIQVDHMMKIFSKKE